jgi:hypothetical protein
VAPRRSWRGGQAAAAIVVLDRGRQRLLTVPRRLRAIGGSELLR